MEQIDIMGGPKANISIPFVLAYSYCNDYYSVFHKIAWI